MILAIIQAKVRGKRRRKAMRRVLVRASFAFDGAEGIARDGDYSLDFYEALVLTLPHELGETALSSVPTLQRENEGDQVNYGTRWFCDGGAQVIGSLFAQREFPQLWRADRERGASRSSVLLVTAELLELKSLNLGQELGCTILIGSGHRGDGKTYKII